MSDIKFKNFSETPETKPVSKFSDVPLKGLPLAMAYVPIQSFDSTYSPEKALRCGTLFAELDKPFRGRFTGASANE